MILQTETERRRVAEIAVEELGAKIPVVIGCTTFTPSQHLGCMRGAGVWTRIMSTLARASRRCAEENPEVSC